MEEGLNEAMESHLEEVWENDKEVRKDLNHLEDKQIKQVAGLKEGEEKVVE